MADGSSVYTLKVASQNLIDSVKDPQFALTMIEQLRGGSSRRAPLPQLSELIDALLRGVPYLGYPMPTDFGVFRGRVDNSISRFENASEFGYCPVKKSNGFGRCHRPGTTVFYGASSVDTVFSELAVDIGDRVHIGVGKLRPGQELTMTAISEIDHIRRFNRPLIGDKSAFETIREHLNALPASDQIRAVIVDAFFADLFIQPASKPIDYKATSILSGLLLDAKADGKPLLDGFFYPSVAHRGGLNAAIRPDSFDRAIEWDNFAVFEITESIGFGLYGRRVIERGQVADPSGAIKWRPESA